jgi:hypothetical protein
VKKTLPIILALVIASSAVWAYNECPFVQVNLSTNQTTNLTVGNKIAFDTVRSAGGLTWDATNYWIKLLPGHTYHLFAMVSGGCSAAGAVAISWKNMTNSTKIGSAIYAPNSTHASNLMGVAAAEAIVSGLTTTNSFAVIIAEQSNLTDIDGSTPYSTASVMMVK